MKSNVVKGLSVLTLATVLLPLAGCSDKTEPTSKVSFNSPAPAGSAAPASTQPKYTSRILYNVFMNLSAPSYPEDGGWFKQEILKRFPGVDFKITMAQGENYNTKLKLLAASNQLPDYFSLDLQTLVQFADEGLIIPVDDLIKKTPNLVKNVRQANWDAVTYNGHIWGVPQGALAGDINNPNVEGFTIRKDWLDNLNMKMPETLDEFHDVLKAFTFNDPDKNGQKDTYGIGVAGADAGLYTAFQGIFGAFGAVGDTNFWMERNGSLKQATTLPEVKEALAVLQQWYKEGLIDPDYPITTNKQLDEKLINSKIGIYTYSSLLAPTTAINASLMKAKPTAKLVYMAPPAGPKGLRGWPEVAPQKKLFGVSKNMKEPQRFFELLDWQGTLEGINMNYGEEGKTYTYDKDSDYIKQNLPEDQSWAMGLGVPFFKSIDRRWMSPEERKAIPVSVKNVIPNATWTVAPDVFNYPNISKLWSENMIKIITGTLPVDAWDDYVKKYYDQGGKVIEKEVNDAWKAKNKK